MQNLIEVLAKKGIQLPESTVDILNNCRSYTVFNSVEELTVAAVGGPNNSSFEVKYDIPGIGMYTEAIVHKVTNGISANYVDPYMRRRDPDTMAIADEEPTDKDSFSERFGYPFENLQIETFDWLNLRILQCSFILQVVKELV